MVNQNLELKLSPLCLAVLALRISGHIVLFFQNILKSDSQGLGCASDYPLFLLFLDPGIIELFTSLSSSLKARSPSYLGDTFRKEKVSS